MLIRVLGLCLAAAAVPGVAAGPEGEEHFLIKCKIRSEAQRRFVLDQVTGNGVDLWEHELPTGRGAVTLLVTPQQLRTIKDRLLCNRETNIRQVEKEMAKLTGTGDAAIGAPTGRFVVARPGAAADFFANYRSYGEIQERLHNVTSSTLDIAVEQAALSHEGRAIDAIRLRPKAAAGAASPAKKIWVSCGQHAREWIAPASCMYLVDRVVREYGADKRITAMLSKHELLVAPMMNPDGYEYSRTKYRYWRKNRRANGSGKFGVDLNRNWPGRWGAIGTSDQPSSDIYRGPAPGSEPEVAMTAAYLRNLTDIAAGIDVHSYGELVLRNYGWTTAPCPDEARFAKIGDAVAGRMNKVDRSNYESKRSGALYAAEGSMDDWIYDVMHAVGMTWEMRDKGTYGFLLPAKFIVPTGKELLEGILTLSEAL